MEALDSESGIGPEKSFLEMANSSRLGSVWPTLAGIVPFIVLLAVDIMVKDDILYKEDGNSPENLLAPTARNDKLEMTFKRLMSSGIRPSKLLNGTEKWTREERFPTEGGISPVKLFAPS